MYIITRIFYMYVYHLLYFIYVALLPHYTEILHLKLMRNVLWKFITARNRVRSLFWVDIPLHNLNTHSALLTFA